MKLILKGLILGFAMMVNVGCASMSPQQQDMFRRGMASWSAQRAQNQGYSNVQLRSIQAQRPMQTQCQSRWVNGTIVSDCSSSPSGIDTSIYGN